jgi:hypothetical protein
VVEGIRESRIPLARSIVPDFTGFDPAHPDSPDAFASLGGPGPPGAPPPRGN